MIQINKTLLSVAISLACAGCGSGTGSQTAAQYSQQPGSTTTGTAVDGYLSAAQVFCDTNKNGLADADEMTVSTDDKGSFTFPSACSSNVVAIGGTSVDTGLPFSGRLQSLAGSAMVTPLTSLMVGTGLTAAQIATALGLPSDTDVSKIDPVAEKNVVLQARTLAMQQIIQQITDTIASLGKNSTGAARQAIYSQVALAAVSLLSSSSTSLMDKDTGVVQLTLLNSIISKSVENMQTTTDASLSTFSGSSGTLFSFSPTSIAALMSPALTNQANRLSKVTSTTTAANLAAAAMLLQANPVIAQAATQLAVLLTKKARTDSDAKSKPLDFTDLSATVETLSDPDSSPAAKKQAGDNASSQANTQASKSDTTPPTVTTASWSQQGNTLTIQDDKIALNGAAFALPDFEDTKTGVSFAKKDNSISLDTIGFNLTVNGTPIPANSSGVMAATVSLALELTDSPTKTTDASGNTTTSNPGRVLQLMLDQLLVSIDSSGVLSVSVPSKAVLYVYGKNSKGTEANLTVSNISTNGFVTFSNGQLTFNAGKVLTRIQNDDKAQSSGASTTYASLNNMTGTFKLKMVVSNLNINSSNSASVDGLAVEVRHSGQPAVSGLGMSGVITITP